jgi:hypothetical protein
MNTYMGYGYDGPEEGAVLIFATSQREAKQLFWRNCQGMMFEAYTEMRVKRLRHSDWLFAEADNAKLLGSCPHVIDSPRVCQRCEHWGLSVIGIDGLCDDCRTEKNQ